jgi:hypothetical protein
MRAVDGVRRHVWVVSYRLLQFSNTDNYNEETMFNARVRKREENVLIPETVIRQ